MGFYTDQVKKFLDTNIGDPADIASAGSSATSTTTSQPPTSFMQPMTVEPAGKKSLGFWGTIWDSIFRPGYAINNGINYLLASSSQQANKGFMKPDLQGAMNGASKGKTQIDLQGNGLHTNATSFWNALGRGIMGEDKTSPADYMVPLDTFGLFHKDELHSDPEKMAQILKTIDDSPDMSQGLKDMLKEKVQTTTGSTLRDVLGGTLLFGAAVATDPVSYINPVGVVKDAATGVNALKNIGKTSTVLHDAEQTASLSRLREAAQNAGPVAPVEVPKFTDNLSETVAPTIRNTEAALQPVVTEATLPTTTTPTVLGDTLRQTTPEIIDSTAKARVAEGVRNLPTAQVDPVLASTRTSLNNARMASDYHTIVKDALARVPGGHSNPVIRRDLADTAILEDGLLAKERQLAAGNVPQMVAKGSETSYPLFPVDVHEVALSPTRLGLKGESANVMAAHAAWEAPNSIVPFSSLSEAAARILDMGHDPIWAEKLAAYDRAPVGSTERTAIGREIVDDVAPIAGNKAGKSRMESANYTGITPSVARYRTAAHLILDNRAALMERAIENQSKIANKNIIDSGAIAGTATQSVDTAIASSDSAVNMARGITQAVGEDVNKAAEAAGATEAGKTAAQAIIVNHLEDLGITKTGLAQLEADITNSNIRAAEQYTRNADSQIAAGRIRQHQQAMTEGTSIYGNILAANPELRAGLDISLEDVQLQNSILRGLQSIWLRIQDKTSINGWQIFQRGATSGTSALKKMTDTLKEMSKRHTIQDSQAALQAIQSGTTPASASARAAYEDLKNAVGWHVDVANGNQSLMMHYPVDQVNKAMAEAGLPSVYHFVDNAESIKQAQNALNKAEREVSVAKQTGAVDLKIKEDAARVLSETLEKLKTDGPANSFNNWKNIEDPWDFLTKLSNAHVSLEVKSKVAADFAVRFKGRVPSLVQDAKSLGAEGYRFPTGEQGSILPFLPHNMMFDQEALKELKKTEDLISKPLSYAGSKSALGKAMNEVLDPVTNMLKLTQTAMRPGHHIRNFFSDWAFTGLDGFWSPKHYADAATIMRQTKVYDANLTQAMDQAFGKLPLIGGDFKSVTLKNGTINASAADMAQMAQSSGLLASFQHTEDFERFAKGGKLVRMSEKVMQSKPVQAVGNYAEWQSHYMQTAHFSALMSRAKFTQQFDTIQEAALAAALRVKQFHPDPSMLLPYERRVMRRIIPYYSWQRVAVPTILYQTLSHPGRITLLPKATYSAMIAQGIDPTKISMSDQFPDDKMYPSFVTDALTGPVIGGSGTVNFGTPTETLSDTFKGNPMRNVLGMLSPYIKAPVELNTSTDIGTGAHISDKGEYFDRMTPFVNQASNLSGLSFWGSVSNTVTMNGDVPDLQRSVQKGEKNLFFNSAVLNFLSGLNYQDVQKPTFTRLASRGQ